MDIRTSRWAASLAALCFVAPAFAQQPPATPAKPGQQAPRLTKVAAEKLIQEQDAKRIEAMVKADLPALETLFTKDMVYTHSSGKVDTKVTLLEALKAGTTKYLSVGLSEQKYQVLGNTVIVTGIADVKVQGAQGEVAFKARFTEVWTRQRNEWRFAAWQTTKLAEEKK